MDTDLFPAKGVREHQEALHPFGPPHSSISPTLHYSAQRHFVVSTMDKPTGFCHKRGRRSIEMPEICRFFGIVVTMYWNDHNPPHFHARYGEWNAEIDIQTMAILQGGLPPRAMALTIEWALAHQRELLEQWERARHQQHLQSIPPLT